MCRFYEPSLCAKGFCALVKEVRHVWAGKTLIANGGLNKENEEVK